MHTRPATHTFPHIPIPSNSTLTHPHFLLKRLFPRATRGEHLHSCLGLVPLLIMHESHTYASRGLWDFGGGVARKKERDVCVCVCVRACLPLPHTHLLSQKALSEGEFASRRFFVCLRLVVHRGTVQARMCSVIWTMNEGPQRQCVLGGAWGTKCGLWVCGHQ